MKTKSANKNGIPKFTSKNKKVVVHSVFDSWVVAWGMVMSRSQTTDSQVSRSASYSEYINHNYAQSFIYVN